MSNVTWADIKENNGTFEHIGATGFDRIATVPGKDSFTSTLIQSLKDLLNQYEGRPFSSFHLQQRMAKARPAK